MKRSRNFASLLPCLLLLAVLLSFAGIGTALAKYVTQAELQGNVTITAHLGKIEVLEHKAKRNTDGSYSLLDETTTENTYYLIPGLDIPKDPYVHITEKCTPPQVCEIGAYVYLVVDSNITPSPTGVSYDMLDCWVLLEGYDDVYVYSNQYGPIVVQSDLDIAILAKDGKGNSIIVSQKLNTTISETLRLNFTAQMRQVIDGKSAKEIYEDTINY